MKYVRFRIIDPQKYMISSNFICLVTLATKMTKFLGALVVAIPGISRLSAGLTTVVSFAPPRRAPGSAVHRKRTSISPSVAAAGLGKFRKIWGNVC